MYLRITIVGLIFIACSCKLNKVETATAQTAGNDPTIKRGEVFSYSKSKEPKVFDFICFLGEVPTMAEKYLMVYRLCGMPGDKVQIKNGDFYLNDKLVDGKFSVKHNYLIPKYEFERLKSWIAIDDNFPTNFEADTLNIPLDDKFVVTNKINAKRQILPPSLRDSIILNKFSKEWNLDNFGPIEVPKEAYFVLGDNRHNAWDSRYRGFISKEDFLGTVIRK